MANRKSEWNDLPCPACKEPVKVDATRCPYCTAEFTAKQVSERKAQHVARMGCAGFLGVALAVLLAFCSAPSENASTPVNSELSKTEPTQAPRSTASPEITSAIDELWGRVVSAGLACDIIDLRGSDTLGRGDPYAAYDRVNAMVSVCDDWPGEIERLPIIPDIQGEPRERLAEALRQCDAAMTSRSEALNALKTALDGDARPSIVRQYRDKTTDALNSARTCDYLFMQAGGMLGVPEALIKRRGIVTPIRRSQ